MIVVTPNAEEDIPILDQRSGLPFSHEDGGFDDIPEESSGTESAGEEKDGNKAKQEKDSELVDADAAEDMAMLKKGKLLVTLGAQSPIPRPKYSSLEEHAQAAENHPAVRKRTHFNLTYDEASELFFRLGFFGDAPDEAMAEKDPIIKRLRDKELEAQDGVMEALDPHDTGMCTHEVRHCSLAYSFA